MPARIPPAAIFNHSSDCSPRRGGAASMLARLFILLLLALSAESVHAQFATPTLPFVQVGVAGTPGVGLQVGFAQPSGTVFTQEGALYADYAPRFFGDEGRLLVGLGLGGSVRVLRIL